MARPSSTLDFPERLAELHTHLGGSVASETMWSIAHEQGIALPVKDYWEFDALVTVSDPHGVQGLDELDGRGRSVHAAFPGVSTADRGAIVGGPPSRAEAAMTATLSRTESAVAST